MENQSILIKGMKMPESCYECTIKSWDGEDYFCPFTGVSTLCIDRQVNCPLIEVKKIVRANIIGWVEVNKNG